ncbi:Nmad5 family putative nucleotide modification protein [Xanthobacter sediminis]
MTKSARLNSFRIERFERALLQHRFSADVTALAAAHADLADKVYADVLSPAARRKIEALPAGWLPEAQIITAQFGDSCHYVELHFSGRLQGFGFHAWPDAMQDARRRVPHRYVRGCAATYEPTHPLAEIFRSLQARREDLVMRVGEARYQIKAALSGCSTTGQLRARWPEAAPFVADLEPSGRAAVPAVELAEINSALRLPPTTTGAAR